MASIALISLLALGSAFAAHRPQLAANPPVLSLSSSSAAPPSAVPTPLVNPAQPDVISATNNYTVPGASLISSSGAEHANGGSQSLTGAQSISTCRSVPTCDGIWQLAARTALT